MTLESCHMSVVHDYSPNQLAKAAGIAFLLIVVVPMLSILFIETRISVTDDIVATIDNILANEWLFRIDATISLLMFIGVCRTIGTVVRNTQAS